MIKTQKCSKNIVKIVHVTLVVHRNCMKLREYVLCEKKTKIRTLFNNSFLPHHHFDDAMMMCMIFLRVNNECVVILSKMGTWGNNC